MTPEQQEKLARSLPELYDRLNAVCFGSRLRPVVIRLVPWAISKDDGERLAGAWVADSHSIALDKALLRYSALLFGTLLHEMVHQACYERDGVTDHDGQFLRTATEAVARLSASGVPMPLPTNDDMSMWPYPVARQLLGEI